VDAALDTVATALYVRTDDLLKNLSGMGAMAVGDRDIPADLRRRAGDPRGDAGPPRVHLRGAVAAVCARPPSASVCLPAWPVRTSASKMDKADSTVQQTCGRALNGLPCFSCSVRIMRLERAKALGEAGRDMAKNGRAHSEQ